MKKKILLVIIVLAITAINLILFANFYNTKIEKSSNEIKTIKSKI